MAVAEGELGEPARIEDPPLGGLVQRRQTIEVEQPVVGIQIPTLEERYYCRQGQQNHPQVVEV
jgi:hypothetical protein